MTLTLRSMPGAFHIQNVGGVGSQAGELVLKLKAEPWTHSSLATLVCCFFPCPHHFAGLPLGDSDVREGENSFPLRLSKSEVPPLFRRQRGCQDCLEEGNAFLGLGILQGVSFPQLLPRLSILSVISPLPLRTGPGRWRHRADANPRAIPPGRGQEPPAHTQVSRRPHPREKGPPRRRGTCLDAGGQRGSGPRGGPRQVTGRGWL